MPHWPEGDPSFRQIRVVGQAAGSRSLSVELDLEGLGAGSLRSPGPRGIWRLGKRRRDRDSETQRS